MKSMSPLLDSIPQIINASRPGVALYTCQQGCACDACDQEQTQEKVGEGTADIDEEDCHAKGDCLVEAEPVLEEVNDTVECWREGNGEGNPRWTEDAANRGVEKSVGSEVLGPAAWRQGRDTLSLPESYPGYDDEGDGVDIAHCAVGENARATNGCELGSIQLGLAKESQHDLSPPAGGGLRLRLSRRNGLRHVSCYSDLPVSGL